MHCLAQTFALQRIEVGQRSTGYRLGRYVQQAEAGGAAGPLVRQHGHTLRRAVMLETSAQINPSGGGHFAMRLGYLNARYRHAVDLDIGNLDLQGW
ncbi:hypothetical protein D9M71_368770 [compost metagenome]